MLDKHIKERWVKALKSGQYQQTDGTLRRKADDKYSYCCLGVLVDILPDTAWYPLSGSSTFGYHFGEESRYAFLGPLLLATTGLEYRDMYTLMGKNDNGVSFTEIADYITEKC